jgi:hypothetical protein
MSVRWRRPSPVVPLWMGTGAVIAWQHARAEPRRRCGETGPGDEGVVGGMVQVPRLTAFRPGCHLRSHRVIV